MVAALLDDGLARGYADAEIGGWLQERLQLIHASSLTALTDITPRPQVVYLDPMFPHKQKSALVKKEMRVFQSLLGPDLDADGLLAPARNPGASPPPVWSPAGGSRHAERGGDQRASV